MSADLESWHDRPTIESVLERARSQLRRASFSPPQREARLLLARALDWSEAQLLSRPDHVVEGSTLTLFQSWLERRLLGEPVAYLLGEREFFGRNFVVDARALVPRPETEHLVDRALTLPLPDNARVLDIGTGTGCIAATLALERESWRLFASDLSPAALALAALNFRRHQLDRRVSLLAGDLLDPVVTDRLDLIVCNPPYIDREQAESVSLEVRDFEPGLALFAAQGGLALYQRLFEALASRRTQTPLLVEIGFDQIEALRSCAALHGLQVRWVGKDLAGHTRVLELAFSV